MKRIDIIRVPCAAKGSGGFLLVLNRQFPQSHNAIFSSSHQLISFVIEKHDILKRIGFCEIRLKTALQVESIDVGYIVIDDTMAETYLEHFLSIEYRNVLAPTPQAMNSPFDQLFLRHLVQIQNNYLGLNRDVCNQIISRL